MSSKITKLDNRLSSPEDGIVDLFWEVEGSWVKKSHFYDAVVPVWKKNVENP